MAWTALFKTELQALTRSWVVRGWIIALVLAELFTLAISMPQSRAATVPASSILTANLMLFLFAWSVVIIVLGAGSVSLESDVIADSILSRPCTRTQFISAKFASRVLVVIGIYLFATLIAATSAWRYGANDMTIASTATGVAVVGLAVLFLLSIGIMFSVLFNNTVTAVASLLLIWYVATQIFGFIGADYLSPQSVARNLPRMLKDANAVQLAQGLATTSGISLTFSKSLDTQTAEQPGNYQIESVEGTAFTATMATYDKPANSVVLTGITLPPGARLKVTARNVTDVGGLAISPAANSVDIVVPAEPSTTTSTIAAQDHAAPIVSSGNSAGLQTRLDTRPPAISTCVATGTSVKLTFSTSMNAVELENLSNYIIESPLGTIQVAHAAMYSPASHSVLLSGCTFREDDTVKVTIKNVHSAAGNLLPLGKNSATYAALTTWKYVVGFGLPTVLAFIISIVWFARRDL